MKRKIREMDVIKADKNFFSRTMKSIHKKESIWKEQEKKFGKPVKKLEKMFEEDMDKIVKRIHKKYPFVKIKFYNNFVPTHPFIDYATVMEKQNLK